MTDKLEHAEIEGRDSSSRDLGEHPCGEQPSPTVIATAALAGKSLGEKLFEAVAETYGREVKWSEQPASERWEYETSALAFAASLSHDETATAVMAAQAEEIERLQIDNDIVHSSLRSALVYEHVATRQAETVTTLSARLDEATNEIAILNCSADVLTEEIVAQSDLITEMDAKLAESEAREGAMYQALTDIIDPLSYLRRKAEEQGRRLSGAAYAIAGIPETLKTIARDALATLTLQGRG